MEWCLSGLKSSVANRVYGNTVPRVQIPLTPIKPIAVSKIDAIDKG